jgi:hypothetical protein
MHVVRPSNRHLRGVGLHGGSINGYRKSFSYICDGYCCCGLFLRWFWAEVVDGRWEGVRCGWLRGGKLPYEDIIFRWTVDSGWNIRVAGQH